MTTRRSPGLFAAGETPDASIARARLRTGVMGGVVPPGGVCDMAKIGKGMGRIGYRLRYHRRTFCARNKS